MHFLHRLDNAMLQEVLEHVQIRNQVEDLGVAALVHLEDSLRFNLDVGLY